MRESLAITRHIPSPWLGRYHIRQRVHRYCKVTCKEFRGRNIENESEKKLHWEGVEPPPLALGSELEGKDDNRFTTSVLQESASHSS